MTDTNKMREQFETWYGDECGLGAPAVRSWRKGERYSNQYERCGIAWVAWQASRQAVVVELPREHFEFEGDKAPEMFSSDVIKAIEAQGLRVSVRT